MTPRRNPTRTLNPSKQRRVMSVRSMHERIDIIQVLTCAHKPRTAPRQSQKTKPTWWPSRYIHPNRRCPYLTFSRQEYLPRPGFPLAAGQVALGPLVLDRTKRIMVPASINTYLREYQRDGVRFFWDLYDQDRGGLLGDDMGLVRLLFFPIAFLLSP